MLRGCPALVFPLQSRNLEFSFEAPAVKSTEPLKLELFGPHGEELELLFWGVLEKACSLRLIPRQEIQGLVKINSSIPVGAGLGASAALSVAVAKWFFDLKILREDELLEFSRQLENLFHGESSGVDLAVALSGRPLKYLRQGNSLGHFSPSWVPQWYLSYSGKRGVTRDCVNQVKNLLQQKPDLGEAIDADMKTSVEIAEKALLQPPNLGLPELVRSISLAKSCFDRWGLNEGLPEQHMNFLLSHGALAVKPTGSGNGGYVLSLWSEKPPSTVLASLIPCF